MKELPRYKDCFICGCDNKAGADVLFVKTEKGVETRYTAQKKAQLLPGNYSRGRDCGTPG